MKQALLTLSILLVCMVAQATPITTEKAKENAMAFLMSGNKQQRMKGIRNLKLVYSRTESKGVVTPLFHVFNIDDGNGFIIASADDVAVPVLGFCDSGEFDLANIPSNMQAWLDGYGEEISKARENGDVPKGNAPAHASRQKINPMVKSTWGQREPYNDRCIFNGIRCVTGCVATVMAQVMYYWATTGINGKTFKGGSTALPAYTTETQKYPVGALGALTSFDWASMTDGKPTTEKGKTAVATLMRYCGQSVKMDYEKEGSAASVKAAADALQNCFDYNWSLQFVSTDQMTEEDWQALAYQELSGGRPFVMSGGSDSNRHAFICDGYDPATETYHFNWGWNGDYDGWFAMTSLRPGGYDFSSTKSGIKGIQPLGNSPYVVLSTDGKTLSFYCDGKRKERSGTIYHLSSTSYGTPEWIDAKAVEHVVFDSSFAEARPISTYSWFNGMKQLKDITGLAYLNTSEVTYMGYMFYGCSSLERVDVSHFDTSKVISMGFMFYNCNQLESLDLSHFDTSKVTNFQFMFYGCNSLESVDVSHFNTSEVSDMSYMFDGCNSLKKLDVSHFSTANVTKMSAMFSHCNSLESLDVSRFNTSNVSDMSYMFYKCNNLKSLDVGNFATANVTKMNSMFSDCNSLESLDVSRFNTSNVSDMGCMFDGCNSLKSLDVGNFATANVTKMNAMFYDCNSLESLDVSRFNTSKVTNMGMMFFGCKNLKNLDTSNFDTSNVTVMSCMFYDCNSLESLDVSRFTTSNVSDMSYLFYGCNNLKSLDVSNFNTSNATNMYAMFYSCNSLESIDVSHFDTSKVKNVSWMFFSCKKLQSLDVGNFNVSNVEESNNFASFCYDLQYLRVASGMEAFNENSFKYVGLYGLCQLSAPEGFDFGFTPSSNERFSWKGGYFVLAGIFAMGDVNHDGQVNVTDVTLTVEFVMGGQPKVFYKENADVNHDTLINVTDISLIVEATLGT